MKNSFITQDLSFIIITIINIKVFLLKQKRFEYISVQIMITCILKIVKNRHLQVRWRSL